MAAVRESIFPSSLGDVEVRRVEAHPSSLIELQAPAARFEWPGFARDHGETVRRLLHSQGALVLRGFGLDSPEACERFAESLTGGLLEYNERSSPRHSVHGRVYTSTDHPAREEIIYIVEGVAEQWVDRDKRSLKAGECAFIPAKVVHAIHNVSKAPMSFLAILSPAVAKGPFLVDCYDDEPWRSLRTPYAARRRRS